MVNGSMNIKALKSNSINMITPEVDYDFKFTTPSKLTSSINLAEITTVDMFYKANVLHNQNVSKIQLVTKNVVSDMYSKDTVITLNLNGKNIMTAPLDAVDSCSFMIEAKKIESLEIKLDKLSEGMLYIIYEHSLLPAEANTSLTMV